jgi:transcriptional regulator with XRE-family HTH domain
VAAAGSFSLLGAARGDFKLKGIRLPSTPMSSHRLPHYLRTYRKRAGFSQDELAWLLGCRCGTKVSRYERFARTPNLQTVFAYEIIFGVPARELCAGIFEVVSRATSKRVESLINRLRALPPSRTVEAKLAALGAIGRRATAPMG